VKLIYIANARLPTEKAHGYQIVKMCEAFSELGVKVLLLHSRRHQDDRRMKNRTVFEYYQLNPSFEVRTLPNPDALRIERFFPSRSFIWFFFLHGLLWGFYAALKARKERADLFYTRDIALAFWLTRLGLPTVFEGHTVPKRARGWLLHQMAHHPHLRLVVLLTSHLKESFAELGFDQERLAVFPDGVDLSLFSDLPDKQESRRRLNLSGDLPIIGYIGRFQTMGREKGIPQLIEAMAHLPSINGKVPLLLCVGGPMSRVRDYLELADSAGIPRQMLRFVDRVPNRDVPLWLSALDVAVMPFPETEHYKYFMSPLKLFEYMAAGVPIVATDLPSIREILQHDRDAWLVPPENPESLGRGISTLLQNRDRATRISRSAKERVKRYTWSKRAEGILKKVQKAG